MPLPSFDGRRVLSFESRRAKEIAALITNFGGRPTVAPALKEVPRESQTEALDFAAALTRDEFDAVIFLTGVGTKALAAAVEHAVPRDVLIDALRRTKVIVRGPKPMAVLRDWQVPVWVAAPEPNTWRELLGALDPKIGELPTSPRIAVQEYGVSNPELLDGLRTRGARVTRVPVYQWALPDDTKPLEDAAAALGREEIDVVLFTTGVQVAHLWEIATRLGLEDTVRRGLARAVTPSEPWSAC